VKSAAAKGDEDKQIGLILALQPDSLRIFNMICSAPEPRRILPMSAVERLTVTMPAEMAANLRAVLEEGEYATTSEIVREALRDWARKHDGERRDLEALRAAVSEGDEGEGIPVDAVFAELRALIAERRAAAA